MSVNEERAITLTRLTDPTSCCALMDTSYLRAFTLSVTDLRTVYLMTVTGLKMALKISVTDLKTVVLGQWPDATL